MDEEMEMEGLRGLQSLFEEPRLVSTDDAAFSLDVGGQRIEILQRFDLQATGLTALPDTHTESESRTGAVVWDASVVMTKYFEKNAHELVVGKRCLELGSGCGLVGIGLAVLGAASVLLTDRPEMIPILSGHVARNKTAFPACSVSCETLVWGDEGEPRTPFEVIIAADTIYDIDLVAPFLAALEALSDLNTQVFIGFDTSIGRHQAYSLFRELAAAQFVITLLAAEEREVEGDKEAVEFMHLRRKEGGSKEGVAAGGDDSGRRRL
jgi:predicted nicotinamide N-methyase